MCVCVYEREKDREIERERERARATAHVPRASEARERERHTERRLVRRIALQTLAITTGRAKATISRESASELRRRVTRGGRAHTSRNGKTRCTWRSSALSVRDTYADRHTHTHTPYHQTCANATEANTKYVPTTNLVLSRN